MSTPHQKLLLLPAILGLAASCGGGAASPPSLETASEGQPLGTCETVSRMMDLHSSHVKGLGVVHGTELWRTDGTAAGTVLVKDMIPGHRDGRGPPVRRQWHALLRRV